MVLSFGSLTFVAMGLWMTGMFGSIPETTRYSADFLAVIGWICVFLFSLCGVAYTKDLFGPSEQLRIDAEGLRWKPWSDQIIPWAEITEIRKWEVGSQRGVDLKLRDPAQYRRAGLLALIANGGRTFSGGDVSICLSGTNRKFDEAMAALARFRPHDR